MASDDFEPPVGTPAPGKKKDATGGFDPPLAPKEPLGPDIGQGVAGGRGFFRGLTLGLEGLGAAAGMGEAGGLTGTSYGTPEEILKEQRRLAAERIRVAREQYPKTTTGAELTGALLTPIPAPRGTGFLGRVGTQAGLGGTVGFLGSLGEEDPSLGKTLLQTGVGTLAGAAMPFITTPLAIGARALMEKLGITRLPWFRNVEQEAATGVSRAQEEAALVERQAIDRAAAEGATHERQVLPAHELGAGRPGMTIDVLGAPGRDLARSAANLSPVARGTLEGPLYQRRAAQAQRVEEELAPTLNYPLAGQQRQALARPSPETNRLYNEAREIGDGRIEIANTPLQQLAQMRIVQSAFRAVEGQLGDAHILETMQRQAQGLQPRQAPSLNDLAVWDAVKRKLDDIYKTAVGKAPNRARLVEDTTRQLRTELDRQVPEYAEARARAQAEIVARNAFEEGATFLTRGDPYEMQQALQRMALVSPRALDTFRQGFTHAMLTRMSKKPTQGNLLAQIKETPDQTLRMRIALGEEPTAALGRQRADEAVMQRALEAVTGNSTTARQLQQMGLAAGGGALMGGVALGMTADELTGIGHKIHSGVFGGAALPAIGFITQALTRRPGLHVDQLVAERIAQMLVSRDPAQLARLATLAQQQPALQQALRSLADISVPVATRGAAYEAAGAAAP